MGLLRGAVTMATPKVGTIPCVTSVPINIPGKHDKQTTNYDIASYGRFHEVCENYLAKVVGWAETQTPRSMRQVPHGTDRTTRTRQVEYDWYSQDRKAQTLSRGRKNYLT